MMIATANDGTAEKRRTPHAHRDFNVSTTPMNRSMSAASITHSFDQQRDPADEQLSNVAGGPSDCRERRFCLGGLGTSRRAGARTADAQGADLAVLSTQEWPSLLLLYRRRTRPRRLPGKERSAPA